MSSSVYDKLPRLTPLFQAPQIRSITGHLLPIRGACTLSIAKVPTEVLVCEKLENDLVIGANLLRFAVLDFAGTVFKLGDQSFPMNTTPEAFSLLSATSTFLPQASSRVIADILKAYTDVFSPKDTPLGAASKLPPAEIDTGNTLPIRQKAYRLPFAKREAVEKCVNEMLDDGIIRPSDSPWASPITLVPKKDGSTRFCVDYRQLNTVTRKDAHPLPHIQDVFDQLQGAKVFSTLDLRSGYWQVPLSETAIPKSAFACHLGLFEFVRLPFGLTNAPAIFQRQMTKVLSGLIGKCCMCYIDDVIVFSKDEAQHAKDLASVFQKLREAGLQLKPSKCSFGLHEVELLGFKVNADGIRPLEERVSAIKDLPPPTMPKEVKSFLGMAGYYRQCVPNFADKALPLTELTKPKEPFRWGPEHQKSYDILKQALCEAPILAHPDTSKPYILYTDASDKAIGAILVQKDDNGLERVVSYLSHKLSGAQLRWPTIEKEAYGVVYALRKFHPYLWGAQFEIHTDHKPLKSLFKAEIKNTKLQRWAIQISEYGAPILYHPGKLNVRADMLSRVSACFLSQLAPMTPPLSSPIVIDPPTVWQTDRIDVSELQRLQAVEFPDQLVEAQQAADECRYVLNHGLLYTLAAPKGGVTYHRLLLPHQYRQQVIDRCHVEVGHSAAAKTLARIQEHYVWPGMTKHVMAYVSQCHRCATLDPKSKPTPRGKIQTPSTSFDTWSIDLVGPFPRDQRGRQYLLTCIDHLTGWTESVPIASKNAKTVQEAFLTHVVARYGLPSVLISDNGGEFTSKGFEQWLADCGTQHNLTSPYNPRANGMVERFNGTIQRLIMKLSGGNPRKWSEYLPDALWAYRTTVGPHGLTPYQAVFGKRPRLPRADPDKMDSGERYQAIHQAQVYLKEMLEAQRDKYQADQPKHTVHIPVGANVVVRVRDKTKGQPGWRPGFQVISEHQGGLRVHEPSTGITIRVNQKDVRVVPNPKPYDEIDPIPRVSRKQEEVKPLLPAPPILPQGGLPIHMPAAAEARPPYSTTNPSPNPVGDPRSQKCHNEHPARVYKTDMSSPTISQMKYPSPEAFRDQNIEWNAWCTHVSYLCQKS